jgi:hypothetical protein
MSFEHCDFGQTNIRTINAELVNSKANARCSEYAALQSMIQRKTWLQFNAYRATAQSRGVSSNREVIGFLFADLFE